MTKQKSTKRALLMSALTLLMCVSMLIGSTFAWFTDSVTSGNNKIVAGTLDVQLLMNTGNGYVDISDSTSPIFGEGSIAQNNNADTLWEPGKTQVAYLAIKNNGNLALKYTVGLDVQNVSKDLYKVMEYAITPDAQYNSVTAWADNGNSVVVGTQSVSESVSLGVGETHYFALSIHMDEAAGNEYQGGEVNFDLTVLATQDTVESDSFNNQYDKDAPYILPQGVAAESFDNAETVYTYALVSENKDDMGRGMKETTNAAVAYYNGSYYDSLTSAVNAARLDTTTVGATIYLKPEAELSNAGGYGNVTENLTVYGNGAKVVGGDAANRLAVEVDAKRHFTSDVTINVYDLDGVVVWGNRETAYTLNVNIYDSLVGRVYINKTTGVNNIKVENCTFDAAKGSNPDTSVYSNANGTIVVNNSTFNGISCAINLNHKVDGTQTVVLTNNTFVDCGTGANDYYAAIRAIGTSTNAVTNLTVTGNTVTYSDGVASANEADVLLNTEYTSGSNGATSATGSIVADIQDDLTVKNGANVTMK